MNPNTKWLMNLTSEVIFAEMCLLQDFKNNIITVTARLKMVPPIL